MVQEFPNNSFHLDLTLREAELLWFKCEFILSSGTVEENINLARKIMSQLLTQNFNNKNINQIQYYK